MLIAPKTALTQNEYSPVNSVQFVERTRRPRAGVLSAPPPRSRISRPLEPLRVRYNRSWFVLGAIMALAGLFGLRRYGRPMAAGTGVLGLLTLAHMAIGEPARPTLEHVTLRVPTLPPGLEGLRIGQISDIHLGMPHTERNLEWAIEQMQFARPDLLALTGDMVGHRDGIMRLATLLSRLNAPLGIYAVPGNHDYWEGIDDVRSALSICDIPLLLNEHRHLTWNDTDLWLAGTDDIWDGHYNLRAALRGIPSDGFKLLLSHAPDTADEAADHDVAVQLSGHTHGGHFRLPFLGAFSAPRYGVRYIMGSHTVGRMALYVSRGLGGMPLRLFCRPEITILTLKQG